VKKHPDSPMSANSLARAVPSPFSPAMLGPIRLRNRIIKAATSDGRSPDGLVTDELIAFHRGFVEGGVGMTTVAYATVAKEGFSARGQLLMTRRALPGLRRLTGEMHAAGGAVCAQLGHAGPVANRWITGSTPLSPSWLLNPTSFSFCRAITVPEIKRAVEQFADAAALAAEAGFDAVELHFGHLYLVSAFLSPLLNRRKDEYGGSLENRARLAIDIARAVRKRVGNSIAVTAKLSMSDGIPRSIWVDEALQAAKMLDQDGQLDAIELTQGSSVARQMHLFRGDIPKREMLQTMVDEKYHLPLRTGARLFGDLVLGRFQYKDLYMLEHARQFVPEIKRCKLILLGGINSLEHMQIAMREGFSFVAMGRALLREPDLVKRMEQDPTQTSRCIACNKCMFTVFKKTKCVLNPFYAVLP